MVHRPYAARGADTNTMNERYDPSVTDVSLDVFGFPSQSHAAMKSLHHATERSADEHRRCVARDVDAVYRNDFEHLVCNVLQNRFPPETYEGLRVAASSSKRQNLLRDIVGKLAIAWPGSEAWLKQRDGAAPESDGTPEREAEMREYSGALMLDDEGEVESPEFDALMEAMSLDTMMPVIDAYVLLHPRIAVMPAFVYDDAIQKRCVCFRVLTPEHFTVTCDPTARHIITSFAEYYCAMHDGKTHEMRRVWTRAAYKDQRLEDWGGHKQWRDFGPVQVNPYNRIPVTFFGATKPLTSPWCEVNGEVLAENTVEINAAETFLSLLMLQQVKVLAGEFKPGEFADQLVTPGMVVQFPMGAENVQVLDFQINAGEYRTNFIDAPRREACVANGLNPDEFETSGPESGEARKMREHNKIQQALRRRVFLRDSVVELYWLAVHMLWVAIRDTTQPPVRGFERGLVPPYMPGLSVDKQPLIFGVDITDYEVPELHGERSTRLEWEAEHGLISWVEVFKERNPEFKGNDEEALAEMAKNRAMNRRLGIGQQGGLRVSPPLGQSVPSAAKAKGET